MARYGISQRPKTRRDLAAILAKMREILVAKNAPRFLPREMKFLAVKILLLSHQEAKFSAAKIGSMRTTFTFTLTINQTTRR